MSRFAHPRRSALVFACSVLALALLAESAAGAWRKPVRVASYAGLPAPQLAFDGRGNATIVWEGINGPGIPCCQGSATWSAVWSAATRAWRKPVAVSPTGGSSSAGVAGIAVNSTGAGAALWVSGGSASSLEAAFRPSSAAVWQQPVQISPAGEAVVEGDVGIDADGDVVAIWEAQGGQIVTANRSATTGTWSPPKTLATPGGEAGFEPAIAVDRRGDAVAVWASNATSFPPAAPGPTAQDQVVAAVQPAGGAWGQPVVLGTEFLPPAPVIGYTPGYDSQPPQPIYGYSAGSQARPQVAIAANGDAMVVWQTQQAGRSVALASLLTAGAWQPPALVSSRSAYAPSVGLDARGDATVLWEGPSGAIWAATRAAGSDRFSGSARVRPRGNRTIFSPHIVVNPAGDAIASWGAAWSWSNSAPVWAATRRGPNGRWRRQVNVAPAAYGPDNWQTAIDRHGNGIVAWSSGIGILFAVAYTAG